MTTDIQLSTGVRLRYAEVGPRNAPPVIMLHGYSDSSFSFSRVTHLLSGDLRLIIPDQRGHGDSERPQGVYTLDSFAMDAIALLDELAIPLCTVVGHCFGGFVAQRMAVLAPARISNLVLVSSGATAHNDAIRGLVPDVETLIDPVNIEFVSQFQMSTVHRPVPDAFMAGVIEQSLKLPARVWRAVLTGMLETPFMTVSGSIACPTSILWGDRDQIFGYADQQKLLDRIPGSKLQVFNDVGHTPHWEVPEDFVRYLLLAIGVSTALPA